MSMLTQYYFNKNISKEIQKSNIAQNELKKELEDLKEQFKTIIKEKKEEEANKKEEEKEENKEDISNIQASRNSNQNFKRTIHRKNDQSGLKLNYFYQQTSKELEGIRNMYFNPIQESKEKPKILEEF
mmetsp:Transcript_2318/g.2026  ORF Transcript_2318/g.2026 Transcript_2318/m.2026 type:complete len:128 (+) Transcript_2318:423-806(+)